MEQHLKQLQQQLEQLCLTPGVAGAEQQVANLAHQLLLPYAPNATVDPFYNVSGTVREPKPLQPLVLLEAHLDQIGMIVTHLEPGGFVRMTDCGGVDRRTVSGQEVLVYGQGEKPLVGVVMAIPPHLQPEQAKKFSPLDELVIDMGMSDEALQEQVSPGDRILPKTSFRCLAGTRVTAGALDNRAGVAVVLTTLSLLEQMLPACGIAVLFSSQEEVGHRGAETGGYHYDPDLVISVDVSFAKTPDTTLVQAKEMGKGPIIGIAPSLDGAFSKHLIALAESEQIPYQLEVMRGVTGTNADTLGLLRGGSKAALVALPLKYMHTPVEMVDLTDCYHAAKLIACSLAKPLTAGTTRKGGNCS